jgi:hypothetical protein
MTINYHESPELFRGKGTVWLAFDESDGRYRGYWDLQPDGPPTPLEECPGGASALQVVLWGRARAPRVLIRPKQDQDRYYWAGEQPPQATDMSLPIWQDD